MRLSKALLFIVMTFGLTPSVQAGDQPVVVELYTSQGCSSCPPVDALLGELAKRDDVLALALHVDYWDYIGWKDSFADPQYTLRQKGYAKAGQQRSIYTPQIIVGGVDRVLGYKPMLLADQIAAHGKGAKLANLEVSRSGNRLSVALSPVNGVRKSGPMVLQLVQYAPNRDVKITRGENAGKTLRYWNVVTLWKPIGKWDGRRPKKMSVRLGSGDDNIAVILQAEGHGPIIAAAKLP